jgi:hypothetical protein
MQQVSAGCQYIMNPITYIPGVKNVPSPIMVLTLSPFYNSALSFDSPEQ